MSVSPNPPRKLGSAECYCTVCGRIFSSESGFTDHRIGTLGTPQRRCMTDSELTESGMALQTIRNRWYRPMPEGTFQRSGTRF